VFDSPESAVYSLKKGRGKFFICLLTLSHALPPSKWKHFLNEVMKKTSASDLRNSIELNQVAFCFVAQKPNFYSASDVEKTFFL